MPSQDYPAENSTLWRNIRLLLLVLTFIASAVIDEELVQLNCGWEYALKLTGILFIISIFWAPLICYLDGSLSARGNSLKKYHRPSFSIRPFTKRNPLQFWYYISFVNLSFGLGTIVHVILFQKTIQLELLISIIVPIGILLGCKWTMHLFKRHFEN